MTDLTQIQWGAIEKAHNEDGVEPDEMVRLLLLDPDEVAAALDGLVRAGLMETAHGRYLLTADGEARLKARSARESAEVKRTTGTWQPR